MLLKPGGAAIFELGSMETGTGLCRFDVTTFETSSIESFQFNQFGPQAVKNLFPLFIFLKFVCMMRRVSRSIISID